MSKGAFGIDTPEGWYQKLQADYQSFIQSPGDKHAASTFFVTAESLRDWTGMKPQKAPFKPHHPTRIASHVANAVKHRTITRHNAIKASREDLWAASGWVASGWQRPALNLELTDHEAKIHGAPIIEAIDLAKLVMDFWADWFAKAPELHNPTDDTLAT